MIGYVACSAREDANLTPQVGHPCAESLFAHTFHTAQVTAHVDVRRGRWVHPTSIDANLPSVTGPTVTVPASNSKIRRAGYLANTHWRERPAKTTPPTQD